MGNKRESALDAITSLGNSFVRIVSSGGESVKATIADVSKHVVENYAGSTLAGSAQSVKSAIDAICSNVIADGAGAHNSIYRGKRNCSSRCIYN